jgi:hypothetical protein
VFVELVKKLLSGLYTVVCAVLLYLLGGLTIGVYSQIFRGW